MDTSEREQVFFFAQVDFSSPLSRSDGGFFYAAFSKTIDAHDKTSSASAASVRAMRYPYCNRRIFLFRAKANGNTYLSSRGKKRSMTQQEALTRMQQGKNILLTGEAGSGKTYVLQQFIAWARAEHKKIGITASSGIAATHIGGRTVHSFTGMGMLTTLTSHLLDRLFQKPWLQESLTSLDILIIDEISMLHAFQLDMIDRILQEFNAPGMPFGGVQLILVGDFFQLPPVPPPDRPRDPVFFVYDSASFRAAEMTICYLTRNYRQEDQTLLTLLQAIRQGKTTRDHLDLLEAHQYTSPPHNITSPSLFPYRRQVDMVNERQLQKLSGEAHTYVMTTFLDAHQPESMLAALINGCISPETLTLKIGSAVMFTKNNFSTGIVNGTMGTVIDFSSGCPVVRTANDQVHLVQTETREVKDSFGISTLASITQVPLRLAWAITIHKSQGMTLDSATMDLSRSFLPGQGYVALSRVRTLSTLRLLGISARALEIDPAVAQKDAEFHALSG